MSDGIRPHRAMTLEESEERRRIFLEQEEIAKRNVIILLTHHLADTGLTPGSAELPQVYAALIDDLTDLAI